MKKLLFFAICVMLSSQLSADSFRCGRAIVKSGDSSGKLVSSCGDPSRKFTSKEIITDDGRQVRAGVSNWVYSRAGKRDMVVMLYNGVIVKMRVE